ncbi:MAG: inorganic phosphate transporter [Leptospira sp.]|nr:inorganic phosphate transporter [Leptospira sp.]
MDFSIFYFVLVLMVFLAVFDLIVGVANDAVNFTNSAIGSKVASKKFILIIAAVGVLLGALSSSGMMEVARKGIFRPELFTLEALVYIFLAVMITDVLLLDFYNTFGLPTSTTVSLVFELFGASLMIAFLTKPEGVDAFSYINSESAIKIISGIFMSVIIAFVIGMIIQTILRIIFTFQIEKTLKHFGSTFAALSSSILIFFIIISALKGSNYISKDLLVFIESNLLLLFSFVFLTLLVLFQILVYYQINVLKIIIIFGTFALAMAFASNDLVNFVGVPLASISVVQLILESGDPLALGTALGGKVQTPQIFLFLSAIIMIVTLVFSKKAASVTKTEISLASEKTEIELFTSNQLSRRIVKIFLDIWGFFKDYSPAFISSFIRSRYTKVSTKYHQHESFDLLRASVNVTASSLLILTGTLYKLPLSTTFVTFMVAMGTSLADRAWVRYNAVNRVSGVLTVIGGWFLTAMITTILSGSIALCFYTFGFYAFIFLLPISFFLFISFNKIHKLRSDLSNEFSLPMEDINSNPKSAIYYIFDHLMDNIQDTSNILNSILKALSTGKKSHQKGTGKRLDRLSFLYGSYMVGIAEVDNSEFTQREITHSYNLESSIHSFRKLINNTLSIRKNVLYKIDFQFSALNDEEKEDLKEIKVYIQSIFDEIQSLVKKKRRSDAKMKAYRKEFTVLKFKIHRKQIKRLKSKTAQMAGLVPFLTIVEELFDFSHHLIELYNNVERVLPLMERKN